MMKKLFLFLLCAAMVVGSACTPSRPAAPESDPGTVPASLYTAGTYEAAAMGFGGTVTVKITVSADSITDIQAEGASETAGIGSNALEQLPDKIKAANNADVDIVSGATFTSQAILKAASQALAQAKGDAAEVKAAMKPGAYTGSGYGYSLISPIVVEVTVSEDAIQEIRVLEATRETAPIFNSAAERMIPRMIEHQSISVDSVTGATAASSGIRAAVTDALTQAILAGGGSEGELAAFEVIIPKKEASEVIEVDVLVVGMGGSGCAAALSAAETMHKNDPAGVSVLAIDKSAKFGGTSANCAEPMGINAPRYKEAYNAGKDYMDKALMRSAWLEYVDGGAKEEMLDLFLDESGSTIDWLHFDHGVTLNNPTTGFAKTDIYRCKYQYTYIENAEEGRDYGIALEYRNEQVDRYFHNMMDDFKEYGGNYMLETEAYELLYDEANSKVTGAKARKSDGTEYTINAKAVILATGGFAGNGAMEEKYFTNEYYPIKGAWGTYGWGLSQNDGKMLEAAIGIGAGTYNIDMPPMVHFATTKQVITEYPVHVKEGEKVWWYGYDDTWSLNDVPMLMALNSEVLQVDVGGRRYADESELFVWWKAGPEFYGIWSDAQVKEIQANGFKFGGMVIAQGQGGVPAGLPIPEIYDILDLAIAKGYVHKADTLDELAAITGMDAETLKKSVANYNAACAKGVDEEFGKAPEYLFALGEEGPYYAVEAASVVYSTCGALDVDTKIRVLKADGKTPIHGLYAVGNDSGGALYTNTKPYVTFGGAALGWAFTSGRLAGSNSVEYSNGL